MIKYIRGKQPVFNLGYQLIFYSKYRKPHLLHFEECIKHFIIIASKNINIMLNHFYILKNVTSHGTQRKTIIQKSYQ